ncbi:hypothetical protein A4R35_00950 [Thermogemmatispora tikiterensis]|uniref:Uncharacterized protein n=1 Tax=Thermogemmatispora tikiterensis TaxID=1825093 RepID=A0A328VE95_9CHLR|nr:hypothetical protein A4R35_00950 [Thermogemmatispora tikiterensis]
MGLPDSGCVPSFEGMGLSKSSFIGDARARVHGSLFSWWTRASLDAIAQPLDDHMIVCHYLDG